MKLREIMLFLQKNKTNNSTLHIENLLDNMNEKAFLSTLEGINGEIIGQLMGLTVL